MALFSRTPSLFVVVLAYLKVFCAFFYAVKQDSHNETCPEQFVNTLQQLKWRLLFPEL